MAPVPRAGKGDELAVRDAGALAPHEGARPPDLYEQKFMEGDGLVLYRAREVAPWQLHALLLSPAGVVVVATILSGQLAGLLGLPLILMIWLTFLALRVLNPALDYPGLEVTFEVAAAGCDDGGGTDAGGTDAGVAGDSGPPPSVCPTTNVPAPEELMGACCYRHEQTDQHDAPEHGVTSRRGG